MKKYFLPLWMFVLTLSSCTNADPKKMANELCDCIKSKKQVSSTAKKIIVKAGHSDDPVTTLQTDLQKIAGTEEQEQIAQEFQQFESDPQLQQCADEIRKKYNLDEKDKKAQEKILKAAEKNGDCEMVYALMKIGLQQEEKAKSSSAGADD